MKSDFNKLVNAKLFHQCIINGEEVTLENVMTKRQAIIQNHIRDVYPIKEMGDDKNKRYYTKLNPKDRNHSGLIKSSTYEDLEAKIVAHYLEIELQNKTTVLDILELCLMDLEPLTAKRHKQIFNKFLSSLGDKKISSLCEADIRNVLQRMIDNGITSKNFNNCISTLNKINDYCVYNHIPMVNIREKISEFRKCKMLGKKVFIKTVKSETELSFSEAEAITLLKYIIANPDYHNLAIGVLITTGIRVGELLALLPEDVDLEENRISLYKMERVKTYEIIDGCKDNSDRIVFLNDDAVKIFSLLLDLRSKDPSTCRYLFLNSNSDDGKLHLRAIDNRLRQLQDITGINQVAIRSPHDCRRTYASIQYLHGIDIKTIQAQLGHSKPTQTWEYIKDIIDLKTRQNRLSEGCIL